MPGRLVVKATPQVILNTTRNLAYNYNVLAVNCEQNWKVSGHGSISVVSPRNNLLRNHGNASYSVF